MGVKIAQYHAVQRFMEQTSIQIYGTSCVTKLYLGPSRPTNLHPHPNFVCCVSNFYYYSLQWDTDKYLFWKVSTQILFSRLVLKSWMVRINAILWHLCKHGLGIDLINIVYLPGDWTNNFFMVELSDQTPPMLHCDCRTPVVFCLANCLSRWMYFVMGCSHKLLYNFFLHVFHHVFIWMWF